MGNAEEQNSGKLSRKEEFRDMRKEKQIRNYTNSKKRFGELLKKYRKNADYSQSNVADMIGKSQSYVGMLETAERQPAGLKEIHTLSNILKLGVEEEVEFRSSALGTWYEMGGVPLLLRDGLMELLDDTQHGTIWVLGPTPLEFSKDSRNYEDIFEVVYEKVKERQTTYTYWLPESCQKDFDIFLNRLRVDLHNRDGIPKERTKTNIECILAASNLPLMMNCVNFAIYDPFSDEHRKGHAAIYDQDDESVGVVPYSKTRVNTIYQYLLPIYEKLEKKKKVSMGGETSFTKYYPE